MNSSGVIDDRIASNLSGIIAPIITGWLKQRTGSYHAGAWAILVVLLLGLTAYGMLVRVNQTPERRLAHA